MTVAPPSDPYAAYKKAVARVSPRWNRDRWPGSGSVSTDIADVIAAAVSAKRPRTRYLINAVAKSLVATRALLPARASDRVIALQFGLPR